MKKLFMGILMVMVMVVGMVGVASAGDTDINGWRKAKWGMSYSELSKIYKLDVLKNSKDLTYYYCNPKDNNINIKGLDYKCLFRFDKNKKLVEVSFMSMRSFKNIKDQVHIKNSIDNILKALTGKYGESSRKWVTKLGYYTYHYIWSSNNGSVYFNYEYLSNNMYLTELKYNKIDGDI